MKQKKPKVIYVKLNHDDLIQFKRGFLEVEFNLLRSLQFIKRYSTLREKELILKMILKKKISFTLKNIRETLFLLPKIEKIKKRKNQEKEKVKLDYEESLEDQLRNIQRKLSLLK